VLVLAYLFRGLLLPLLLAAAAAYFLNPLVVRAEALGIRRNVAVTWLYAGIGLLLVLGWLLLGTRIRSETVSLVEGLPSVTDRVDAALSAAAGELREAYPALRRILPTGSTGGGWLDRFLESRTARLDDLVHQAGTVFILTVLVPFFAFFLLRDSRRIVAFVMDRVPPAYIETSVAVWCEVDRIIGGYLRGVALDALAIGVLASVGLWAFGVPYPIFLGAFAGLANTVPFLGPILGASAASLVVLTQTHSLAGVGRVVLLFVVVKIVDDAVIQPLTIGRSLHLHPALLLASVVAGNQALGILGMIVAVPTITALQEVTRLVIEHRHALAGTHRAARAPVAAPKYLC